MQIYVYASRPYNTYSDITRNTTSQMHAAHNCSVKSETAYGRSTSINVFGTICQLVQDLHKINKGKTLTC